MKVSIITIVYNNRLCIEDCIQSVLNQTYSKIEHIIIDGGSTDGTIDIIEKYRDKLSCFISEKDNGLYNALNKGIRLASGDIIGILHSDDLFYDNDTIRKVVNEIKDKKVDLLYAKGQYVDRDNIQNIKRIYPSKPYSFSYLKYGWIPLHTTIYVKRELFEQFGLYHENYKIASDYEISLRWFTNPDIEKVYFDEWLVRMRLGGKSTNPRLQRLKSKEDLEIIRQYNLCGYFTLICKIARKIPQYIVPKLIKV